MEWMYYILLEWIWNKKWEKNEHVIINGKNSYDEPNDSDIKRYEEIRKLTTGQDGDYTTGCLLDYDYITQGGVKVLQKMANYEDARVKLTNNKLKKLQSAAKSKTGASLRITLKKF